MFTGMIEETGTVRSVRRGADSAALCIAARDILPGLKIGDSVAVNGVCLTVTSLASDGFTADVMHETLRRSTLGGLVPGGRVNLERAMRADGRFGGHLVSGHIDGIGTVITVRRDGIAVWYTVSVPQKLMRGLVEKGSVSIDGISLTVAEVTAETFSVSVIPHTAACTTLSEKTSGSRVNLETDLIGKYVEKLLSARVSLDGDFLAENGF